MTDRGIKIDEKRWPIVRVEFFDHATVEDWQWAADQVEALLDRLTPFAVVADGSHLAVMPDVRQRQIGASLDLRVEKSPKGKYLVCWANVVRSAPVRGAITAIHWLSPPSPSLFKRTTVATLSDAYAWCDAEMRAVAGPRTIDTGASS